jgi:hypothetical protein
VYDSEYGRIIYDHERRVAVLEEQVKQLEKSNDDIHKDLKTIRDAAVHGRGAAVATLITTLIGAVMVFAEWIVTHGPALAHTVR